MFNLTRLARSPQRDQPSDSLENDERPLPFGWVRAISNNVDPDRVYYTNGVQSQWNFPNQEEPFIQLQRLANESRARFQERQARFQERRARFQELRPRIQCADESRRLARNINPPGPHYLSVETRIALALLPDTYIDPRLESWENMSTRYEYFNVNFNTTFGQHFGGHLFFPDGNRALFENILAIGDTTGEKGYRFVILTAGQLRPGQQLLPLTRKQEVQLQDVRDVLARIQREEAERKSRLLARIINPPRPHYLSVETRRAVALLPHAQLSQPDTDAVFQRGVGGVFEDAVMHLRGELDSCLAKVNHLLTFEEQSLKLYPNKAMEAFKELMILKFQSTSFLVPPGSPLGRGNIGGIELGRILSKPVYAGLEIQDAPKPEPVGEDGYKRVTVKFVDTSKPDVETQMVFNTTMVGPVTARGRTYYMYDIYLCTDSNVYWRGYK